MPQDVESRAGAEPLDLLFGHRVGRLDVVDGAVFVIDDHGDRLAGSQVGEADDVDRVAGADPVEIRRIGEREREDALLLEVRLVDAREGADDDRRSAHEARFHRSVLT